MFLPCILGLSTLLQSQKSISGKSSVASFNMKMDYKRGVPPKLYAELNFEDDNGNGVIEANEDARLHITIYNKGEGIAQGLQVQVIDENEENNLDIKIPQKEIYILHPGASTEVSIPISADLYINSGEHKLKINVLEHFGYDMDPAFLILNTLEYQAPKIVFSGYEVIDAEEGTGTIIADGQVQPGELVKVKIYVQNVGQNTAKGINYKVISASPNVFIDNGTGSLDDMLVGEVRDFWVTMSPNKRMHAHENLPVQLTIDIDKKKGSLLDFDMPVAINQKPPKTEILQVKPNMNLIRQQIARFEFTSNEFTANVGKIENIREVPVTTTKKADAVAVVLGIENYNELPPAPYAENDARLIKDYFEKCLGISKVVVYTSDRANGLIFDDIFNPEYGELQKAIVKEETDVYVFYSGHGIPSKDGEQIYLFPSDGKVARLQVQGYDLNNFYKNLNLLGARSVTVFIDACFSGASRSSEKIEMENLVAMKGIRVKPKIINPWHTNANFSVITSSGIEETSLALDASQSGLFT
ncbi:MAG: caspase family protein, partial [Bacteroidales bacterium]|nr:caspase family protein [Bacteroidales bacterium]